MKVKKICIMIYESVLKRTLFLFFFFSVSPLLYSRPLGHSIYTVPEGEIDLGIAEQLVTTNNRYRRDRVSFGLGMLTDLSLFISFNYLHSGYFESSTGELGDTELSVMYYCGDFFHNRIMLGVVTTFIIPTGRDVYSSTEWANLSFGNNELQCGPVIQFMVHRHVAVTLDLRYVFREAEGEGFYNGFSLNPGERDTYKKIFGLNPFVEDTFFTLKRLKNDYVKGIFSIQTDLLLPVILYSELYTSFRLYRKRIAQDDLPIEAARYDPVFLSSLGIRYFISHKTFIGVYFVINLRDHDRFIQNSIGCEASLHL